MNTIDKPREMKPTPVDGFCGRLFELLAKERLVLFAGAGVGVQAGLPGQAVISGPTVHSSAYSP